jgi:hypothetical protein
MAGRSTFLRLKLPFWTGGLTRNQNNHEISAGSHNKAGSSLHGVGYDECCSDSSVSVKGGPSGSQMLMKFKARRW